MLAAPATVTNEEFGSDLAFLRSTRGSTATDATTMILTRTGNVGIGTGVPAEKLNIYTATGRNFKVNQSTANVTILENDYELELRSGGGYDLKLNANGSSTYGNVTFRTDGSERMRVTSAGNVGIGTTTPIDELHVEGVIQSKKQLLPSTSGTAGWYKIGTMSGFVQGGATAVLEIAGHQGYNAANNQDYLIKLFIKTSNASSTGPNGQGFNSWYERTGGNNATIEFKWNNSATNDYDLYMFIPTHSLNSWYSVKKGTGTWEHAGTSATDPGANSSTVLKATGLFNILDANVGIGTTSPGAKLQIGSATYAPNANLANNLLQIKSPSGFAYLTIGNGDSANATSYIGGASGFIVLGSVTDAGAKSEHIRMTNTGNVGIGTTSPEAKLTIKGDALNTNQPVRITNSVTDTHTGLFLNNTGSTVGEKYGMQFGGYNQYSIGGIFGVLDSASGSTSGDITFDMCNGTSAGSLIERMRITHEGKVGIGTTSPGSLLHLSSSTGPRITLTDTDASIGVDSIIADISFVGTEIGGETARIGAVSETSGGEAGLRFYTGQSVLERLRIDKDGNVGIGTTSPESKLQVAGGIQMANDTATASAAKVGTMRYRTGTEYVEVTGAEILTNPGFDTDTTWVKGTGWTIANGKASVDNASSTALSQPSFGVTTGKIYNVRIDVSNYTSGSLQLQFGASQVIASISANGEYNYTVTSTITGGTFYLYGVGDCEFSVDNASVIEVEAEDASYADMCMQTGASTYEWVNIVRNTY